MADKKFTVHRSMHGDGRDYERGDTRVMSEADAAPLVATGALAPEGEDPLVPAAAVEHTFGQRASEVNERGYTSPSGEGVAVPRSPVTARGKAKPAPAPTPSPTPAPAPSPTE